VEQQAKTGPSASVNHFSRKDYKQSRANVAFNISRMFESLLRGLAEHNSFQNLIVSTLVKKCDFMASFPQDRVTSSEPVFIAAKISSSHGPEWLLAIKHLSPLSNT